MFEEERREVVMVLVFINEVLTIIINVFMVGLSF